MKDLNEHKIELSVQLNSKGLKYKNNSEYEKAIECYKESLQLNWSPRTLNNLGVAYRCMYNFEKAMECYQKALEFCGSDNTLKDSIKNNIAKLEKDNTQVEQKLLEAISSKRQNLQIDKHLAIIYNSLGQHYLSIKYYDEALKCHKDALSIDESLKEENGKAHDFLYIGRVYFEKGEYSNAQLYLIKAYQIFSAINFKSGIFDSRYLIIQLMVKQNQLESAFELLETNALLENEIRQNISGDSQLNFLDNNHTSIYEELTLKCIKQENFELAVKTIELFKNPYLVNEMIKNENSIKERMSFKIEDIDLNEETAILYYATLGTQIYLFIISKTRGFFKRNKINIRLAKNDLQSEELKNEMQDFDDLLSSGQIPAWSEEVNDEVKKKNVSLYQIIPIEDYTNKWFNSFIVAATEFIKDKKKLVIIKDSLFQSVPFEVFKMPDGQYLINKYYIKYAHSLTSYYILSNRKYETERKRMKFFCSASYNKENNIEISDDDYAKFKKNESSIRKGKGRTDSLKNNEIETRDDYYKNLLGSHIEVKRYKELFGLEEDDEVTGEKVNRQSILNDSNLDKYRYINFSVHGHVDIGNKDQTGLVLSFNKETGEYDYLTPNDIKTLKLNADLIALNACVSALGKPQIRDGIVGLVQSFLIAGANGVLSTLWPVDDEVSAIFIILFYEKIEKENLSYEKALAEVKKLFINSKFSDPFYWAPFVYYGK